MYAHVMIIFITEIILIVVQTKIGSFPKKKSKIEGNFK